MVDAEQIEDWADEVYAASGKETTWSISQVRCKEEGCPPVETILTDLSVKKPCPGRGVYKVFKDFKDVTREDVEQALREGNEAGGHGGHTGGHEGGHGAGHDGGGHGGDCCEGHGGHGDAHGHDSGHGHEEHGGHGSEHGCR
uniref:Uncharacterized protein n=1 Tax=Alexandrium catenella TaxID=2925 RepID=A0A7S1MMV2_ALECA|mmetsp:Transcript_30029/g.81403  ORF Transcript_30029/g.81403 Transcript_30029/m.81403 type:complete len:142 (+) Transcript_30029:56-481(+)